MDGNHVQIGSDLIKAWLLELTNTNFLAVYDIVLDIRQQFQLSDEATIDLRVQIVSPELQILPAAETAQLSDRSHELRWKAAETLYKKEIVSELKVTEGNRHWPTRLCVRANVPVFNAFADLMDKEFEQRSEANTTDNKRYHGRRRKPRRSSPWLSGLFYLFAAIVIIISLVTASMFVPVWELPFIFAATVLLVVVIGAMQLRHDAALKDSSFVQLMIETLRRLLSLKK